MDDHAFLTGEAGEETMLAGGLHLPHAEEEELPAVLVVHGASGVGGTDFISDYAARQFIDMGLAVFLIDSFSARGLVTDQTELGRLNVTYDIYRALQVMAEHPRIDPDRIAVVGYSRGADSALYAAMDRFRDKHGADGGSDFAAYVGFYPTCNREWRDREAVADAPILVLHGEADDLALVEDCEAYVQELQDAGADATLIAYPGAAHVFDAPAVAPAFREAALNPGRCRIGESDDNEVVNLETGEIFDPRTDPCVGQGFSIGYDEEASRQAYADLGAFLAEALQLDSDPSGASEDEAAARASEAGEAIAVVVERSEEIGPFDGKPFREITGRLEGEAPGGAYSVPVTLVLPADAEDHSGAALVDVVNTITVTDEDFVLNGEPQPRGRDHLGDTFLFGRGNAYLAVIWDKDAVEALGEGKIAEPEDGYAILRDAAAVARDPGTHLPEEAGLDALASSERVIAYGFSQTGSLLRDWFQGRNTEAGEPTFDGGLVAGAAGLCLQLADGDWLPCEGPAVDGAKVIALVPQTDLEWGADLERAEHPDYRYIEIAGVSHIPVQSTDFREVGMPEQNPVDFGPVFRAAMVNLKGWLDGEEPPPSVEMELGDMLSADGEAGAPRGRYTGFALDWVNENPYFAIAGTFEPFPQDRLTELYPSRQAYIDRVTAAARALAEHGYILPEDAEAYIGAAERDAPVD